MIEVKRAAASPATAYGDEPTNEADVLLMATSRIQAALPVGVGQPKEQWPRASRFMLNQDTGGAIKGPGRVDLFCGSGEWADYTAGNMTARGQLYFLVLTPKN